MQSWSEQDFDEMCWHDCHVYGWRIGEGEYGCGNLTLDLDYITRWEQPAEGGCLFHVAPATLEFFDINQLAMSIDYQGCAIGPFSIDGIERTILFDIPAGRSYRFDIQVNFPFEGFLRFIGNQFRQTLRGDPIRSSSQSLDPAERAKFRPSNDMDGRG